LTHLHPHDLPHHLSLQLQLLRLDSVSIPEMSPIQIVPWTQGHQVYNDLDQPLLLEHVSHVFEALKVAKDEFGFAVLEAYFQLHGFT